MQGLWAWACLLPVTAAHALRCATPGGWHCSQAAGSPAWMPAHSRTHSTHRAADSYCPAPPFFLSPSCSRSAPAAQRLALGPSLAAGLLLFGGGLLVESVADWQKFTWKSDPGEPAVKASQSSRQPLSH